MTDQAKKYEFTDQTMQHEGRTLRRIRRLRDGLVGGWIEKEENLSHRGECFVYEEAKVFGGALICGNAWICGEALVYGNALISGNAQVCDKVQVCGTAEVSGNARINGYAKVCDNARVCDDARIYEYAYVYGNAWIKGKRVISGATRISCDMAATDNDNKKPPSTTKPALNLHTLTATVKANKDPNGTHTMTLEIFGRTVTLQDGDVVTLAFPEDPQCL